MVVILVLVAVVLAAAVFAGWRMFAEETSPRAANALLMILAALSVAWWVLSNVSFDAGI